MKFTREQLNREIANLREPEPMIHPLNPDTVEWCSIEMGGLVRWLPRHNYLSDANVMLELLEDIFVESRISNNVSLKMFGEVESFSYQFELLDFATCMPRFLGGSRDLRVSTAIAWYEMKTGEVVELEE